MTEASARAAPQGAERLELARTLMDEFARETGLEGGAEPRRYLWTDAFAVCNELTLHTRTGSPHHLERALALVDQVHHVLGRHRPDDPREGWISGLREEEAELHPTTGGLRIGKPLGERGAREPPDPRLEWEQDGQYYHYLTRWMHALSRVADVSGRDRYLAWAIELARVAQGAFLRSTGPGAPERLVWKMSIDLSRPLVDTMGHHDPLDGLLTLATLREAERARDDRAEPSSLDGEVARLLAMCEGRGWATDDPLGVGGLLGDVVRLAGLMARRQLPDTGLLEGLLGDAARSLDAYRRTGSLALPPSHRLPFRELGLAIGLAGIERLLAPGDGEAAEGGALDERKQGLLALLRPHLPLRARIETGWLEPRARQAATWTEHLDINRVMLATSLAPDEYLG